jgi:type II secretory pathway pseudopilin PulG
VLTRPHPEREAAFTMIELIVGMILAAIVLGAAVVALTSMFSGASERSVDRKAAARAADVLERFERDMRSAESPERLNSPVVRDEMRAIVLWGVSKGTNGTVSAITPGNPCTTPSERSKDYCEFQDITVSNSNAVYFRADVDAGVTGHECVIWRVAADRSLWRTVRRDHRRCYTNDLGSVLSDERVLQAPPAGGPLGNSQGRSASFGYLIRYNPASDGPGQYNTIVDPTNCVSQSFYPLATNLVDMRRGFITNVTLDLSAWTTGGEATGTAASSARQRLTTSATIASRSNDDYAYATGCGQ